VDADDDGADEDACCSALSEEGAMSLACYCEQRGCPSYDELGDFDDCVQIGSKSYRREGCGVIVIHHAARFGGSTYTFDATTRELIAAQSSGDTPSGPCEVITYTTGDPAECDDVSECTLCEGDDAACAPP
jgi:hypothetical protein